MPKTRDQLRSEYELEVLRATVYRDLNRAAAIRLIIRREYDRVLAERIGRDSA
jgi:hypothetical protein